MFRLPKFYGKRSVKLAFEFGLVVSEVAKDKGIELTPEISERAEKIFVSELNQYGLQQTALNFIPMTLATFETK